MVSYIFRMKQKPIQFLKQENTEFEQYRKSKGKNEKHSKIMGFLNIFCEAEIHTIFKSWEKWIPYWKIMGKKNISKTWLSYKLNILCVAEIHSFLQFQKQGKSEFPIIRKKYGKTQKFQPNLMFFLHISHEAKIHNIPKSWDEWSPIKQTWENNVWECIYKFPYYSIFIFCGKPYHYQDRGFGGNL